MTEIKTIHQIREKSFQALIKILGPGDALRYVRSYDPGSGNYTKEKYEKPDEELDQMVQRIRYDN